MFGLFKSPPFSDPQLGQLVRSRGHWRGSLTLADGALVPLVLTGTRNEPDAQAAAAARELSTRLASLLPTIGAALFEHYAPYAEALSSGEISPSADALPGIVGPGDIWPHVSLVYVSVTPLDGVLTTELAYTTAWDEEHTLGARFQSWGFIELCGSVLPP